MKELKVKKSIVLNTDISTVWKALTQPEMTKKYLAGTEVISDWKVGSPILWKGEKKIMMKGLIEKIETGKLIQVTTFDLNAKYNDVPSNYVQATYELTPKLGKTVLSVTQGDYSRVENGTKEFTNADGDWTQKLIALKTFLDR